MFPLRNSESVRLENEGEEENDEEEEEEGKEEEEEEEDEETEEEEQDEWRRSEGDLVTIGLDKSSSKSTLKTSKLRWI